MKRILICSLALLPILASADTLTLRDGTRQEGTLVSATARRVTFLDANGRRRVFNITDIEQLSFGQPVSHTAADRNQVLRKLRDDVRNAMDSVTLSGDHQMRLQRVSDTLTAVERDMRDGRLDWVDRQDVRDAMTDLRDVLNAGVLRATDRQRIQDDLTALRDIQREARNSQSGTRSRSTDYNRERY